MRNKADEIHLGSRVNIGPLLAPAVVARIIAALTRGRAESNDERFANLYTEALNRFQTLRYLNAIEVVVDDKER